MKKFQKSVFYVLLLILIIIPIISSATAGGTVSPTPTIPNPFNCGSTPDAQCTILDLITMILKNVVMPIAAVASVLYILWAGFQYVMARGNPAKIAEANKNLMWVLIGVGVLLGAAGISEVVQNTVKSLLN